MSRTRHVRPRRSRHDPSISAKKPDEGRRWLRRNVNPKSPPARDVRRGWTGPGDDDLRDDGDGDGYGYGYGYG